MLGYFGKEVVSSPYRPSKEDVDNYILAKDKGEFNLIPPEVLHLLWGIKASMENLRK